MGSGANACRRGFVDLAPEDAAEQEPAHLAAGASEEARNRHRNRQRADSEQETHGATPSDVYSGVALTYPLTSRARRRFNRRVTSGARRFPSGLAHVDWPGQRPRPVAHVRRTPASQVVLV